MVSTHSGVVCSESAIDREYVLYKHNDVSSALLNELIDCVLSYLALYNVIASTFCPKPFV